MNYGKTAYLKILDLEKELSYSSKSTNNETSYLELYKPNINQLISKNTNAIIDFPPISVQTNQSICFQSKITTNTTTSGNLNFELIVDNSVVYEETKNLPSGDNDIVIFKTFTPLSSGNINLSIRFYTQDQSLSVTLKNVSMIILGAKGESVNAEIEMRAIEIPHLNQVLISYIDYNKLYYCQEQLSVKGLTFQDFSYYMPAKSHCFCFESFPNEQKPNPDILLYRVDTNGNLYYSKSIHGGTEQLIETNVCQVYACPCPLVSDDTNIIAYIKEDNNCYFRTLRENVIVSEKKLPLPAGKYKDLFIITKDNCDHIYILATHENGSNYIIKSLIEVSTGKIVEMLNCSYNIITSKYIDISSVIKDKNIECLKMNINYSLETVLKYDKLFDKACKEALFVTYNMTATPYTIISSTTYGVKLDKSVITAGQWETYTDDAEGLDGAYMDFANDKFIDNGWLSRWPFNQIKPCLLKNGEVIGYLNPNDYSKFENGNEATINDYTAGQVMVEIPYMAYHISKDNNFIYIKISSDMKDDFVDSPFWYKGIKHNKIYVSAYLSVPTTYKKTGYYSNSGTSINNINSFSYTKDHQYLTLTGAGFEFMPYNTMILLQCLYTIMFKNTDCQTALGFGYGTIQSGSFTTGKMDTSGMYYGKSTSGSGVKCFGIEDLYGTRSILCPGFYIDEKYKPRIIDVHDPNSSYAPADITNYLIADDSANMSGGSLNRISTDVWGNPNIGFFYCDKSTSNKMGFCDASNYKYNTEATEVGALLTNNNQGIFNVATVNKSNQSSARSARLIYYPQ